MFDLVDPESKGFIPWEAFTRIITSIAPARMLRADIQQFFDSQTGQKDCTVNYREFVMSGKVLLLEKAHPQKEKLSVRGWIRRQRQFTGNADTYTWKNHLQWFKKNQCRTVLWLMRKATKAFGMIEVFRTTSMYLAHVGKRALAVDWLIKTANHVINTNIEREAAKNRLILLSLKARRTKSNRAEAYRFLENTGRVARAEKDPVGELPVNDKVLSLLPLEDTISVGPVVEHLSVEKVKLQVDPPKRKADYGTLYRVNYTRKIAIAWLQTRAVAAKAHSLHQDKDWWLLHSYAQQVYLLNQYNINQLCSHFITVPFYK